jgi:hypothetical protein
MTASTITRGKTPRAITRPKDSTEGRRPRRASAMGTDDDFCHILVGGNGYTRCGIRINPPLTNAQTHSAKGACPGGHPWCPDCGERR